MMTHPVTQPLLKHNLQVPRYTSYPTANHFTPATDYQQHTRWLSALPSDTPISLYIHIPFCKKMCWYCGCNTKATLQYEPVTKFLDYLKQEMTLVARTSPHPLTVSHIHFGGGSPSYLLADDFIALMRHIRKSFTLLPNVEIAIELDPRELAETKIAAYKKAGVNRVSLGVQDFHGHVQAAINRVQPLHTVYDAMTLLRHYGISNINMDLLYGLPNQTLDDIEENIDIAAGLNPSRISLFGYAHVPWAKSHMKMIDPSALPDGSLRLDQYTAASNKLLTKGYTRIGLDHFVQHTDPMFEAYKNKTLKRNFQGYTTDTADILLGFGPSAISSLPNGYIQNAVSNRDYFTALDKGNLPAAKGVSISKEDKTIRQLIEQLMCYMETDLRALPSGELIDLLDIPSIRQQLEPLCADGLITMVGSYITVHSSTPQAVRLVCAAVDAYHQPSQKKHAQVA